VVRHAMQQTCQEAKPCCQRQKHNGPRITHMLHVQLRVWLNGDNAVHGS
jgi:hypothetical protein